MINWRDHTLCNLSLTTSVSCLWQRTRTRLSLIPTVAGEKPLEVSNDLPEKPFRRGCTQTFLPAAVESDHIIFIAIDHKRQ